ncbi:MAG: Hsp20/alpha crystallin family protein [Nanoarchaeota archaeon]|nr:Hsp20/alpha crystallin family protein [Nanoarchaeota archaeon]
MYEWFDEMQKMRNEMDRIFKEFDGRDALDYDPKGKAIAKQMRCPTMNQYETHTKLVTEIELPGVDKNDVKLFIAEDHAEVKVEQKHEAEVKGYYRKEARSQNFFRRIPFPVKVNVDLAKAEQKDGVLRIEIPKLKIDHKNIRQLQIE